MEAFAPFLISDRSAALEPNKLERLRGILAMPRRILITTHHKPDADALGSSLGLAGLLEALGHEVFVVSPTDYPRFLNWMPKADQVVEYSEGGQARAHELANWAEYIFCLDFSSISRINDFGPVIMAASATKIMVDHHLAPEALADADLTFWDPEAAATAELIFLIAEALGLHGYISPEVANCLYAGLMTDTGSFRHPSTTPRVHEIAAALMRAGSDAARVHRLIFDNNSEQRLRFMGFALSSKMTVLPQYRTAYFSITAAELKQFDMKTGDTEGVVNFALSLENIVLAAIIIDRTELVRMSFRSAGAFDVNVLARTHFEGGGHRNASGGRSTDTLETTVERFVTLLDTYKNELAETIKA
jgi:bifunctional oligoribonuclease and PAP phosphatase NrnA